MKYIGLDISLTSTGIVAINKGKIIKQHLVKPKMKGRKKDRAIMQIKQEIVKTVQEISSSSSCRVMIEDFAYGILHMKHCTNCVFEIGGLGYSVSIALMEMGYDIRKVEPTVLKKFVTGKGNAKKDIMIKEILKKWKVDFNSNDLADAYALARLREAQDK